MHGHSAHAIVRCLLVACVACSAAPALSQEDDPLDQARDAFRDAMRRVMIPQTSLSDGPQVRSAFREVVADAAQASVEVRAAGKKVALGGIVGSDGWVITKADQIKESVTCKLKDGREFDARLVGVDKAYDLAMLKLDAKDLPTLDLKRDDDSTVGEWVATVAPRRDPVAVGIVAVDTRKIRPQRGWLGIQMDLTRNVARIAMVYEGSAAEEAGLLVNDVIIKVNDESTPTREKLFRSIGKHTAGDTIDLVVERGGKQVQLQAALTPPVKGMPNQRKEFQNSLGSQLSRRRFGFTHAFQHDTVLKPEDCGGPLVDLEGRVVGFNIARSGRTESYAVPANIAVTRFFDLMSGNLAPAGSSDDQANVTDDLDAEADVDKQPDADETTEPQSAPDSTTEE